MLNISMYLCNVGNYSLVPRPIQKQAWECG